MNLPNVIVVGVDGSPGSLDALRFAVAEANRRAGSVRVVTAYDHPDYVAALYGAPLTLNASEIVENIRFDTERQVKETLADDPAPPAVEVVVSAGSAGPTLVESARKADLLVVGQRGRGAFASTLLGSVSLFCALHAECPVTIVRSAPQRGRTP